jgi:hypothetical protein
MGNPLSSTSPASLAQLVILAVIPQATTEPNQTGPTTNAAQPDLPRPNWTVENRRLAVIISPKQLLSWSNTLGDGRRRSSDESASINRQVR